MKLPVYADKNTKKYLLSSFKYCFKNTIDYPATLNIYNLNKFHQYKDGNNKIILKTIPVKHGKINSICYIINNKCAYAPDVNKIYYKDIKHFKNLKYFVVDCLRYTHHPSHFNLDDILELIKIIKPKKTILTNMNNEMDYSYLCRILPNNIVPGYDGMSFYI